MSNASRSLWVVGPIAAALFMSGCERQPTSVASSSPPPATTANIDEESTTITPFPDVNSLFEEHKPFLFEVTGAPVEFTLNATWSPVSPVVDGSAGELLYSTDKAVNEHGIGVSEESATERGYVAVLLPKKPKDTFELHFYRGSSGFKVGETLQVVLPKHAADMRAVGVWVSAGVAHKDGGINVRAGETITILKHAQRFESEDNSAFVVYTLTATGAKDDAQTSAP
ncbi:hypothetical protein [Lignipirellula cremea]|uniref:Lipoprotein n=1 Tax=Lignipirellula cremea TaxID=2528010 RepID=A0A518DQH7_9BACT|nr:hypothetical protein [Lignipirellula cremea]QDU94079.1 hypothetical protein Pla8534_18650 [Lignipirellula cremea]